MKNFLKKHCIFPIILLIFLCGCTDKNGDVYGKRHVLKYVNSICKEPYELISTEQIASAPDNIEYTFRTTDDRQLTFTANSYLDSIGIDDSSSMFYEKRVSCNYISAIHDLYYDKVKNSLRNYESYNAKDGWWYLYSFEDIDSAISAISEANEIYAEELSYNNEDFLRENPICSVHFVWFASKEDAAEHTDWVNICNLPVNGCDTYQELYDSLANQYAQLVVDGEIKDRNDIPKQYRKDKHVSQLEHIYLNGQEMLYDTKHSSYSSCNLSTDNYCYCWYNDELGSYMLVSDIGYLSDDSSIPLIIMEYVNALGGTYKINKHTGESSWEINENHWTMDATFSNFNSDQTVTKFHVSKNGIPLNLPYLTLEEDSHVHATFCVGLTVDDFASLFDLSYEIDEESRTLFFEETN